ncbi:MAG: twin-arginine translocase subunit TatC [bacterium]|nr:twin-arginine translocase subunit TatC [bacterium]
MTFTEHLAELRNRIIYCGVALVIGFIACYFLREDIWRLVAGPLLEQEGASWITLDPIEAFLVQLKLAAYAGVILASPVLIYHICAFVFPGLRPREKNGVAVILTGGTFLILAGVSVAYFGTLPLVLPYVMDIMTPDEVGTHLGMARTVNLLLKFYLAFAVAFQFPMIVLVLVWLGLLEPSTLRSYRKIAIVGIAVGSALLTPPDPISMLVMMLPLVLLYEVSIWLSYVVVRLRGKRQAAEDAEYQAERAKRRKKKKRKPKPKPESTDTGSKEPPRPGAKEPAHLKESETDADEPADEGTDSVGMEDEENTD